MITICINDKLTDNFLSNFKDYSIQEISKYEFDKIKEEYNFDFIIYYYLENGYEGAGYLIARKEDKYFLHCCGHCSCYGPIEHISTSYPYNSVQEIYDNSSDELKKLIMPLLEGLSI